MAEDSANVTPTKAIGAIIVLLIVLAVVYFAVAGSHKTSPVTSVTQQTTAQKGGTTSTPAVTTTPATGQTSSPTTIPPANSNMTITLSQVQQAMPGNWAGPYATSSTGPFFGIQNLTVTLSGAGFAISSQKISLSSSWVRFNNATNAKKYLPYAAQYYNANTTGVSTGTVGNASYSYYSVSNSRTFGNLSVMYAVDGQYVINIYTGGPGAVPYNATQAQMRQILSAQLADLHIS